MIQKSVLLTLILVFFTLSLSAQRLDVLRDEIKQVEEEIQVTNELLSKTQKNQKNTIQQLNLIRSKIQSRKNIIHNLDQQSNLIENDIGTKNSTIHTLEGNLTQLRKEYGEMIYDAYKNYKLNNFMLFLFASRDFNDATLRIAYMRRYNRMRERKAAEIDSLASSVNREVVTLQGQKEELDKVRNNRNVELTSLGKDETQYRSTADQLKKESGALSSTIQAAKNKIDRLQNEIRRIITEESRKNNTRPQTSEQREYNAILSGKFDQNMGKLPYPVRGVIIDRFGIHPSATIKGQVVNNPGVNIAAEQGAEVRAVFEGEVSQVVIIPGMGKGILIRHGTYLTLYANLASTSVNVGDKITLNQPIGQVGSSDDAGPYIHFGVWKMTEGQSEATKLDPEKWLRR